MRLALLLLLLLWAAPAAAQSETAFRASFVTAIAAHGADLSTTAWCRGANTCVEVNPVHRWAQNSPVKLGLSKMGIAGALQLAPYWLHRKGHKKAAFWFNVGQTVAFTGLAIRNARLVSTHP